MKSSIKAVTICSMFAMCLMSKGQQSFVGANNAGAGNPFMRSELGRRMVREQMQARNRQRQQRLQADTEKLLNQVNDLQQQMRSNVELSPSDLSRRAAEIEKLARSVQNKMKGDS